MLKQEMWSGSAGGRSPSVVIVEDDRDVREVLRSLVTAFGLRVIADVERGDHGLDEIRRRRPDLVLIDLSLPELSGIDVIAAVRHESASVKFIVVTGRSENRFLDGAMAAGASAYLSKPVDPVQLGDAIKEMRSKRSFKGTLT